MSSLEKPKRKKKVTGFKQKQKQQQTVIVNINKQKRPSAPRNNGIEKPKEKEQPKTYNSFSFSMPQAQNPIGDYLKVYQKDLFTKIEQAIKTKDPVINSTNEILNSLITVERTPTVLEQIPVPTTLDNFLKNQEELRKPVIIGEPTILQEVTTLDEPSISLDDIEEPISFVPPIPEQSPTPEIGSPPELSSPSKPSPLPEISPSEITRDTVESIKRVEEPPNLFKALSPSRPERKFEVEERRSNSPIELGAPVGNLPATPRRGRPPLSAEEKAFRAEVKASLTRPVGRPYGSTTIRERINNEPFRQQSTDLTIPSRIQRRKEENAFTGIEPKSAPQRRASLNFGSRLGSTL